MTEVPYEIPDSWKWKKLGEILDVRDGTHDTPKYTTEGVPLLTSKNLVNGTLVREPSKLISIEDSTAINQRSLVENNDVLLAMIGSIGNPVLVKNVNYQFSVKNVAIFKNYPSKQMYMVYVYLFLVYYSEELRNNSSGAVQSFVSLTHLRNSLIPTPTFSEQKRIADQIQVSFDKVNQLI